jgi:hypothetical protein
MMSHRRVGKSNCVHTHLNPNSIAAQLAVFSICKVLCFSWQW